jgi:hypothetical protein
VRSGILGACAWRSRRIAPPTRRPGERNRGETEVAFVVQDGTIVIPAKGGVEHLQTVPSRKRASAIV